MVRNKFELFQAFEIFMAIHYLHKHNVSFMNLSDLFHKSFDDKLWNEYVIWVPLKREGKHAITIFSSLG